MTRILEPVVVDKPTLRCSEEATFQCRAVGCRAVQARICVTAWVTSRAELALLFSIFAWHCGAVFSVVVSFSTQKEAREPAETRVGESCESCLAGSFVE